MSSQSRVPDISLETEPQPPQLASLGWALRRAAWGLLILLVTAVLVAWLLYASIDPEEASASPPAQGEQASPQR